VRAALDIAAAVGRLETHAAEPLAVRIGIATGLVVVGDFSGKGALWENAVVGETPNLDTNSVLRPIITQLERAAGFKADDRPASLRVRAMRPS